MGDTQAVYEEMSKTFPHHAGSIWEDLARSSASRIAIADTTWKPAKRWWRGTHDREIDVVSESSNGKYILVGEAKWSDVVDTERTLRKLKENATQLPVEPGQELRFALWYKGKAATRGELHCISPNKVLDALI